LLENVLEGSADQPGGAVTASVVGAAGAGPAGALWVPAGADSGAGAVAGDDASGADMVGAAAGAAVLIIDAG